MSELLNFILDHEKHFRRARLPSLYSDFRLQRTTNPDGYAANVSAWQAALAKAARAGLLPSRSSSRDLLILNTGQELLQALETKETGRPLALGTVVVGAFQAYTTISRYRERLLRASPQQHEAVAQKRMIPLRDFLASKTSIYHKSWATIPWQAISWGLAQLGLVDGVSGDTDLSEGQFVLLENVEEAGRRVFQLVSARTHWVDRVFCKTLFRQEFSRTLNDHQELTDMDINVLLAYLVRDKRLIAYDGETIRFLTSTARATTITAEDTTIASLRMLITNINMQVAALTARTEDLALAARKAVSSKNRPAALAALRSRKLTESTLARRSEVLAQLEEVYSKIEQAADQVEIVRVMEASTGVLKSLNSKLGGVEKVQDVVEELREEMGKVDEIGDAINAVGQGEAIVDDGEVDKELEAMEREQQSEREKLEASETMRRLAELTSVPDTNKSEKVGLVDDPRQGTAPSEVGESTAGLGRMSLDERSSDNHGIAKHTETGSLANEMA